MRSKIVIAAQIALLLPLAVTARRTTRPNLRPEPAVAPTSEPTEDIPGFTVLTDSVPVQLSGYEKPLHATRETFFATNTGDSSTVCRIWITATYYDVDWRMLHRRSESVDAHVPAGETRQISIPSWDRQKVFYYEHSAPVRAAGTPYKITITVDSALIAGN